MGTGITRYLIYALGIVPLILLSIIIWASYRGLDLSDESFYLVGYFFGIEPVISASYFHRVYKFCFHWLDLSIPHVRILRLFLSILAMIIFFWSTLRFSKENVKRVGSLNKKMLLLLLTMGSLIGFSAGPITLSYNSLSSLILVLVVSCWLLVHSRISGKPFINFTMGCIMGFLFYTKVTNFILIISFLPVASYCMYTIKGGYLRAIRDTLKQIIFSFMGSAVSIYMLLDHDLSLSDNLELFVSSFSQTDDSYTITNLLTTYWENFTSVREHIELIILYILILELVIAQLNKRFSSPWLSSLKHIVLTSIIGHHLYNNVHLLGGEGEAHNFIEVHLIIYLAALILGFKHLKKFSLMKVNWFLIVVGPILLFVGGLGTNNFITISFLFYMVFFYWSFFFLFQVLEKEARIVLLSLVLIVSFSQVVFSVVRFPYRQSSLYGYDKAIPNNHALRNLYLDDNQARLLKELSFLKNQSVESIFTYNYHLGLSLLLEKKPFSFGWFEWKERGSNNLNLKIIQGAGNLNPEKVVFILPGSVGVNSEMDQQLQQKGVFFLRDFRLIKKVDYYDYGYKRVKSIDVYIHKNSSLINNKS